MVMNLPTIWETQVRTLDQEDPLEKEMAPVCLPREFHGLRRLQATIHGITKDQTQLRN